MSQKREFLGPDHTQIADSLRNLAMVREELGFPSGALELALEAETMTKRLRPSPIQDVVGDASIGSFLVALGRHDEALPYLDRALAFLEKDVRHRSKSVVALLRIGECHRAGGHETLALETFERALVLAETDSWVGLAARPLVSIGESLRRLDRDPRRVLELAARAQAIAEAVEDVDADLDGRILELQAMGRAEP